MGWQDRDYANTPAGRTGNFGGLGTRGSWFPIRGSIITTIIVVNVAIYLFQTFFDGSLMLYRYGALQGNAVIHHYQVWRLVTAQYLHDPHSIFHVVFNMLVLHFLGRQLETIWSWRKLLTIYTLSGLAGNVFFVLLASGHYIDPEIPAVGASGCVYGIAGIVAVFYPNQMIYLYGILPMRMRTLVLVAGGIAAFSILSKGSNYGGEACHLAGLVFGVWWAWRGDAWWSRTEWGIAGTGRRKSGDEASFQQKVDQWRDDAETVDRILRKVHDGGIQTLTEQEKKALMEATERQRERERAAGRVDKL